MNKPSSWRRRYLVEDVYSGGNSGINRQLAELEGRALFWGYDGFNGVAGNLWLSDSTGPGTVLILATSGSNASAPSPFGVSANRRVFYVYDDGVHGPQLWTSDGTPAQTLRLTSFSNTTSSSFGGLLAVGNTLYFVATDPGSGVGNRLRRSDGSVAGTTIVSPTVPVSNGNTSLAEAKGLIYFAGTDPVSVKSGLMSSDGTSSGTVLVKEFPSGTYVSVRTAVNERLVFTATDASNNRVLWVSDGTTAGTTALIDTDLTINSSIGESVRVDDRLFFVGQDQAHGRELWATGPALTAPAMVRDIHVGLIDSGIVHMNAMNGIAYFLADDGVNGYQLWRSDGTGTGTFVVRDDVDFTGTATGVYQMLDQIGRHLVTGAAGGLWVSDGSTTGTRILVSTLTPRYGFLPVNGQAWFPSIEAFAGLGTEPYAFDALAALGPYWCVKPELSLPDNASISARTRLAQTTTISNLSVIVDIGHTWIGDLVIKLVHEDTGTSVTLLDRPTFTGTGNGCSGKLMDISFEDSARLAAETSCGAGARPAYPRDGRYKPATPLSAFNGQTLAGRWRLDVQDAVADDVGTLHEWCLVVNDLIFINGFEVP